MQTARISSRAAMPELRRHNVFRLEIPCADSAGGIQRLSPLKALLRDEQGSNLIEAALVLVLYFTLILGMMNVGIILFAYANTVYASRLAVRYAAVHSSASAVPCTSDKIRSIIKPYLPASGANITSNWSPSNTVGSTFSVTVVVAYTTSLPFTSTKGFQTSTTAQGYILY